MAAGSYTELFFMDEVTALAAGHRPCFECRRTDAAVFAKTAQQQLDRTEPFRANELNALILKDIKPYIRRHHPSAREQIDPNHLPDGAMFGRGETAFLKLGPTALSWSFDGYGVPEPLPDIGERLTPTLTCAALFGGYKAQIDASAAQ